MALSLYDYMAVGHEGAGGGVLTCSIAARLIVLQHGWMIQLVQTRFPCYGGNEARGLYTLIGREREREHISTQSSVTYRVLHYCMLSWIVYA